ncbi:DUF5928 domain-containing protein [Profundibacterium mesophilum]|uniref:Peptide O-xylosyltransferase n=1 Tax=Profundibacterium mesophilum KAUST100406-0324 TaxID=1037889 RepID=A0A921TCM9_9RHOB|nr:DUF5928 domain-containing protein [Profundibacterium mesophilum]KAF0675853.1 EpsK domain-containing protein [Profundibacterium mesophilum KAUST100406-0324]
MAQIAYILLAHKDPDAVIAQVRDLVSSGDSVALHYDACAPRAEMRKLRAALGRAPNVVLVKPRRCGWGDWSLVAASLTAMHTALARFPRCTHLYLISGDCMPIKPAHTIHRALDAADVDHIESFDYFESGWIKTGFRDERLIYRHYFNERRRKWFFYRSIDLQKALGLKRAVPLDLTMMIGSQWWCLRRTTAEALLDFCARRPDVMRFFRTTWIPDEIFFQTLVRHLVPRTQISNRAPTFLAFSEYGMPATFYDDHYEFLRGQDFLFARKISAEAGVLKRRLAALYAARDEVVALSGHGRQLYRFMTGQGRIGQRFAPRFWETESSLGRERELLIVICRKWHVAQRLRERIDRQAGIPSVGFVFDEEHAALPDLGGIENGMAKRTRHRRALLRMLFERFGSDRMVICLDPANIELLRDFDADRSSVRMLEIECSFGDDDLLGHARRIGLAGGTQEGGDLLDLIGALRRKMFGESDAIRDAQFRSISVLREAASGAENATALAAFLGLPLSDCRAILAEGTLFDD